MTQQLAVGSSFGETAKIVLFSTGAAIAYGILHDKVTAHICVAYFSIAHPPVFNTTSPFLLALGWGVLATWWVGLPLGIGLAAAARIGPAPRLGLKDVRGSIVRLMASTAVAAAVSGAVGAFLVATGRAAVPGGWAQVIPVDQHVAFTADAWAHLASYGFGAAGGLVVIATTIWRRLRRQKSVVAAA